MTARRSTFGRALPVLGQRDREAEGWERRFVAEGARAEEMIDLYRELGYEVQTDPVRSDEFGELCQACGVVAEAGFMAIYTRRPRDSEKEEKGMSSPETTAVLREEHQRILAVVDVLEDLFAAEHKETRDGSTATLDLDTIEKCVRFFRLFADACHHGKEEDLLFPELESRGMPHDTGPIAVMLYEHRVGRQHVAAMAASLEGARAGDPEQRARLLAAGRGYIDLIRGHILKEDNVLFEMADQMVDPPACMALCAAYAKVEGRQFEGCSKVQLEALAEEITGLG